MDTEELLSETGSPDEQERSPAEVLEELVEETEAPAESTETAIKQKTDTGAVLASVLACLVGGIVSLLLLTVLGGSGGVLRYFPCLLIPLIMCLATFLFHGDRGTAGIICLAVFTAFTLYLLPAFLAGAETAAHQHVSGFAAPLLAFSKISDANFLTDFSFRSATVLPITFAAIGVVLSSQLFKLLKK